MSITFQKRQKELKRQEKQRAKAERRAQRKLAKQAENAVSNEIPAAPVEQQSEKGFAHSLLLNESSLFTFCLSAGHRNFQFTFPKCLRNSRRSTLPP